MKGVIFAVFAISVANAFLEELILDCDTDDDCKLGIQCCVPEHRFFIVSKRESPPDDILEPVKPKRRQGKCVNYVKVGESCHYPAFAGCGCEPDSQCVYYPETGTTTNSIPRIPPHIPADGLGKRDFIDRPGESWCERNTTKS
ncbi:uncharacterized protein [Watersipora subatra]|uniref:uncharacterized protein n=1 Tax=Watersipora subatra TaxID=2589382 RepID=UPI00355BC327